MTTVKMTRMRIDVITVFPAMFHALRFGVTARAWQQGQLALHLHDLRQYSRDPHERVDDRPYGGGPGMVMTPQPLYDAIGAAKKNNASAQVLYFCPAGVPLQQSHVQKLAQDRTPLICIAGRYEGIDQRIIDRCCDRRVSIGDYVLSGGELPCMVLIDALLRCLPGTLGNADSAVQDSFSLPYLDWPHYTRPENFLGDHVPAVLLQGNHQAIADWRIQQALGYTYRHRPELLKKAHLSEKEQALLSAYLQANEKKEGAQPTPVQTRDKHQESTYNGDSE